MLLICILPEFLGWLKSGMFKIYSTILRMIRSLKIRWLTCILVCTFGNFFAPVLVAAHTVNNLDLGDELENEGYESDWKNFFQNILYLLPRYKRTVFLCKFVRCDHHQPPRSRSLDTMSDLFKNVFWCIIWEMCNKKILPGGCAFFLIPNRFKTQEVCNEAKARSPRMLRHIPDLFKTQEMCDQAIEKNPQGLEAVPDHFKAEKMWKSRWKSVMGAGNCPWSV